MGVQDDAVFKVGWLLATTTELLIGFLQLKDEAQFHLLQDAQARSQAPDPGGPTKGDDAEA